MKSHPSRKLNKTIDLTWTSKNIISYNCDSYTSDNTLNNSQKLFCVARQNSSLQNTLKLNSLLLATEMANDSFYAMLVWHDMKKIFLYYVYLDGII